MTLPKNYSAALYKGQHVQQNSLVNKNKTSKHKIDTPSQLSNY